MGMFSYKIVELEAGGGGGGAHPCHAMALTSLNCHEDASEGQGGSWKMVILGWKNPLCFSQGGMRDQHTPEASAEVPREAGS